MILIFLKPLLLAACLLLLPYITVGLIRKTKAFLQGRRGAPIFQPLQDMAKLLQKGQTVSETATWIFQFTTALNMATMLFIACIVPWLSFKPTLAGDDLFLLLYMLALLRFNSLVAAMDTGSAFGGCGASREAYLSLLTEPAIFITLAALGLGAHSTHLSAIFDFERGVNLYDVPVWLGAAAGLFLCSIIDLSRMPIDDPSTHLELTMVHEAMVLENSGKNLALVEFTHFLKMAVLYGLSVQCMLHVLAYFVHFDELGFGALSVLGVLVMAVLTGIIESVMIKMQWRRTPSFIAYALTMSLFAMAGALVGGAYVHHGL